MQQAFATITIDLEPLNVKPKFPSIRRKILIFKTYKLQNKRYGFIKLKTLEIGHKTILFLLKSVLPGVCKYDSSSHFGNKLDTIEQIQVAVVAMS